VDIPPFGAQAYRWTPDQHSALPKAQILRQAGEYESLVPPRLAGWSPDLPSELAADIDEATARLRDFDNHMLIRLGVESPALGPMSAILLRTESASSSQIEKLTTSARQLALAELGESSKVNANTVVGNVRAMEAALRVADSLDAEAILRMHKELTAGDSTMIGNSGVFRREFVWVGGEDAGPLNAELIAPQHTLVPGAIDDVLAFMRRRDIPTLAKTAIAHAHFETIHPFVDGNGRTGRAVAQALLRRDGITRNVAVPLSAGLLTDTGAYFRDLTEYRRGDAAPIIRRFAIAARYASSTGIELVDDLAGELDRARDRLAGVRRNSKVWDVLPALVGQPVVNTAYLRDVLGLKELSAHRALATLTERGVLKERTGYSRNRVWSHSGILGVLDDYAEKIRRVRG
jgi:Fic family protein